MRRELVAVRGEVTRPSGAARQSRAGTQPSARFATLTKCFASRIARAAERPRDLALAASMLWCAQCTPTGLDTVDLGDNPEPPDLSLDEDYFHCEVQPKVLTAQGCATGAAGENGSCHMARSALRLVEVPIAAVCQGGTVVGGASAESIANFERVRTSVGVDADASPLYRRPLGLDSHPRVIFASDSEAANILRSWLNGGGRP